MRARPKLLNWQLGAPFFVEPWHARLPTLRQWIYLLVGGAPLLTAGRPYSRLAASRGLIAGCQQFTTELVQDCRSVYWAGRRHSLRGMLE